ncbi:MAG: alpha/beta fold hydrolase [Betaproteobacteria bacterium]|jgi:haloalkane dehalogenase|nr:alpha/beta fold hydrolase [Betaproteobacteria bacterium]
MMKILRTPDSHFEGLPGWDFEPHYTTITADDGTPIRIAHAEQGPSDGEPIVLMHGNPTWSYLHRHMLRPLASTGRRVIAVDLVGHGRSDKPASKQDYTLPAHIDWMSKWLLAMDLQNVTLYCQDWGGTIGLHLVVKFPERFDRVAISNSGMPVGGGGNWFLDLWTAVMKRATRFPWFVLKPGFARKISDDVYRAYRAPYPTPEYERGPAKFPVLIAVRPDNPNVPLNKSAWDKLKTFKKPFLTLFGAKDLVARGADKRMQRAIPGAKGQDHAVFPNAKHFIQEDEPELLVEHLIRFLAVKPPATD